MDDPQELFRFTELDRNRPVTSDNYQYSVEWNEEDKEFKATVAELPSLSWAAPLEADALHGIKELVKSEQSDAGQGEKIIRRHKPSKPLKFAKDIFIIVLIAFGVSLLLSTYVVKSYYVPSASMETTLRVNDRILVNLTYAQLGTMKHGDIVVFKDPGGWLGGAQKGGILVKRIIGLPGDKVSCCNSFNNLTVNGKEVSEPYIKLGSKPSEVEFAQKVPKGMLWVMGDNRLQSLDSRYHKDAKPYGYFVPVKDVVGEVIAIYYPFQDFKSLLR